MQCSVYAKNKKPQCKCQTSLAEEYIFSVNYTDIIPLHRWCMSVLRIRSKIKTKRY